MEERSLSGMFRLEENVSRAIGAQETIETVNVLLFDQRVSSACTAMSRK